MIPPPQPPSSNVWTQYVLENPWPLGGVLLIAAIALGWHGLREGLRGRTRVALGLGAVGVAVIMLGSAITTAGEHARLLTRSLIDAAVAKDVVGGMNLFASDATMNAGSPGNPGFDREFIQDRFATLAERYTIESNTITTMKAVTIASDEGEVRLGCLTTVESFPYPNASQWIIRVRQDSDGSWKISRLTFLSINDQSPPLDRIW